jgi:hypothetical protein
MRDTRLSRRQVLKGAGAVGVLGALGIPTAVFASDTKVRWDIISVNFDDGGTLSAGGIASARANDNSKITITGHGTFGSGEDAAVTGGGTWHTYGPTSTATGTGVPTGSGTYEVKRLVSWDPAPGTPPLKHDNIGELEDESAGLVVLRIRYSDGSRGVLTVSCDLVDTPNAVFEGITATKGYVDYWNREHPPTPPGNADRTNFHILDEDDDKD